MTTTQEGTARPTARQLSYLRSLASRTGAVRLATDPLAGQS